MNVYSRATTGPLVGLFALTALFALELSTLATHGANASEATGLLWGLRFRLIVTWWAHADRHARKFSVPFEFDAFVFFAWPVVIPYYLYRSRGRKGLLLGVATWGVYIAPHLAAELVRTVFIR